MKASRFADARLTVEPLPAAHFALAARALSDAAVNRWMYHEWREHAVTERTIAASIANKRNRLWLASVDQCPYGLVALGSISEGDRTATVWYLRFPNVARRAGAMASALSVVAEHAFDELGLNSLTASVHEDNVPSMLLLERVGFKHAGVLRQGFFREGRFVDRVTFDLLKSDRSAAA